MHRRNWLSQASACALWWGMGQKTYAATTLTLAVVPQFPAVEIEKAWSPLLEALSRATGLQLQLRTYASIPKFESDFLAGGPDLAFMNPYHAVMARRAQRYEPLVRDGDKPLTGILVAAVEGSIKGLADLQGARIAFPAPNAFGASLYMRALLTQVHGIRYEASYVKTHTNAYRHVLTQVAQAAGGIRATLERESSAVREGLKVIFETPPAAAHPLSAHPRVAAAERDALRTAFLALAQTPDGLALLKPTTLGRPVIADYERDYVPLERLNLARFVILEKDGE